jgi:diguanylate cyclase (GGDEF)-like protein
MKLRGASWVNVGLALLPAILLGLLVPFVVVRAETAAFYRSYIMLLIAGGVVVSFYALTLVVIVLRSGARSRRLAGDRDVLKRRNRALDGHVQALESEVELLTAMREVSRIASDEVRFEKLVSSVLGVVSELTEAREVTLFLLDASGKRLTPRASLRDGRTRVAQKLGAVRLDAKEAERALEHRTILRTVEMDVLDVIVPLSADQQPLGVLNLSVELTGNAPQKTERAEYVESVLRDISRHVGLAIKMAALHARAVHDGPTGLFNKEQFLRSLSEAVGDARRDKTPLSLIMLDIDHFKLVNDTFGHQTGDRVLVQLAKVMAGNLRRSDTAYRYGGEEMVVLLPGARSAEAAGLAERLRQKVESRKFQGASGESLVVTVSLGVAELTDEIKNPADFVAAVDHALYRAKRGGRNQVRTAQ